MTLRLRLLLAMTALVVLIMVGAVMVIQSQRSFLVAQVDDQLEAAMPIANRAGGIVVGKFGTASVSAEELFG